MRPAELANLKFAAAGRRGLGVKDIIMQNPRDPVEHGAALVVLGEALAELALGMAELSNGLRATYILLEQVQNGSRR
jgi:hypothetical protein